MAEHNELGTKGEELAIVHLRSLGYEIMATNWHTQKEEIDIVAMDGNMLVMVEVKTRSTGYFGEPQVFVNRNKQKLLIKAANDYIRLKGFRGECRFDIISIVMPEGKQPRIDHLKDAFYPY
jgi:putative endonuclease